MASSFSPTNTRTPLADKEVAEIAELFPELADQELRRFITALDCTIDQVLDTYFGLNAEQKQLYSVKSQI